MKSRLGTALAAALIVPALAFSQGPAAGAPGPGMGMGSGMGPGMGMGRGMGMGHGMGMHRWGRHGMGLAWVVNNPKLREQLGITDAQAAKIREQTLAFQKEAIQARADLQVKRLDLHSLMTAATPDRAAIEKSLQAVNAAQFALEKAAIDHHLDMRATLTPEQWQKLQQLRPHMMQMGRRGNGAGPGRGGMMRRGPRPQPQAAPQPAPQP
jgi:Spy/CpxP family protein refolding chaperone